VLRSGGSFVVSSTLRTALGRAPGPMVCSRWLGPSS
jgi:hypothetical protein